MTQLVIFGGCICRALAIKITTAKAVTNSTILKMAAHARILSRRKDDSQAHRNQRRGD
jgi:hypothetical protein